jgi:hypothetical protein
MSALGEMVMDVARAGQHCHALRPNDANKAGGHLHRAAHLDALMLMRA